jgi:hydroxymethylglutaryl-CoA lyase
MPMEQNKDSVLKLVECPRDAMQGWQHLIPTDKKIQYINALLKVGFDTIDFGSFVSPKAIPQMADTAAVIKGLDMQHTTSKLLAIVANLRGAEEAVLHDAITFLGFPFSISETFQQRNANSSIAESLERVQDIQELCIKTDKQLVIYMSMGFGNPYGDVYNEEILLHWVERIAALDIKIISLADTVGLATPAQVHSAVSTLVPAYPDVEIGVHLHAAPHTWEAKLAAAFEAGCKRFDGALKGIGGCPMAGDDLVGNMDTELMIPYFQQQGLQGQLDMEALAVCSKMAAGIFV